LTCDERFKTIPRPIRLRLDSRHVVNIARDRRVRRELRRLGWRVLVAWECQTRLKKRDWLTGRLADFLAD
jgi:G:T-mismatch repair DNA endonuclease (very short patch repair protein)